MTRFNSSYSKWENWKYCWIYLRHFFLQLWSGSEIYYAHSRTIQRNHLYDICIQEQKDFVLLNQTVWLSISRLIILIFDWSPHILQLSVPHLSYMGFFMLFGLSIHFENASLVDFHWFMKIYFELSLCLKSRYQSCFHLFLTIFLSLSYDEAFLPITSSLNLF